MTTRFNQEHVLGHPTGPKNAFPIRSGFFFEMKTVKASELEFISRIKRDGSGVALLDDDQKKELNEREFVDDTYKLQCLSITAGTYIAFGFHAYVVRYK